MNIESLQIRLPKFCVKLDDSKIKIIHGCRDISTDNYEMLFDFHDSFEYVTEFLLLNNFKSISQYLFKHEELSLFVSVYGSYKYYYFKSNDIQTNVDMTIINSTSLLDILRQKLNIDSYKIAIA